MTADFATLRAKMIDGQIRTTDVTDNRLLDVLSSVPRELFVLPQHRSLAYIDEDLLISASGEHGEARFLMEPSPFAKLVQLASVRATDRVLDVGCGSGYSTAVLALLSAHVTGLESDGELAAMARSGLASLGIANAVIVEGPLLGGYGDGAPYDVIMIGGAVEFIPDTLFNQLSEGGRLVAVEGQGNAGVARIYVKSGGLASGRRAFNAAVKPLPGFKKLPAFQF